MSEPEYIQIRNWDRFQYRTKGTLPWIKDYDAQLSDPDYMDLTTAERGFLHDLRLLANKRGNKIRNDAGYLRRVLSVRGPNAARMVLTLLARGFIEPYGFVSKNPAKENQKSALVALPERGQNRLEVEENREETRPMGEEGKPDGPLADSVRYFFKPITRRSDGTSPYTGCIATRGAGGVGYDYHPLGTERPPADWPHPQPSNAEIVSALERERAA